MYQYDPILLIVQMQQRELLKLADQGRLVRAAEKNRSKSYDHVSQIVDWLRCHLSEKSTSQQNTCVRDGTAMTSSFR